MAKPAIKVEGLWKEYVIGAQQKAHGTFYDMLSSSLSAPFRALRKRTTEEQEAESFWALRDVNFEVQPGEVVGIIGRNGAGKSTLLKILSRITAPTRGHVEVRGRLASLLEVGTGFHPELSGRENIFLNGAILGMTRTEVLRKFDEIVAFAEIEKFVDTPVKRYSSGMYVRLAFAVAAHLEPEVLVVDEVLAVGDVAFQQKCLGKMGEVSRDGRTVVFVSHNMDAVNMLCSRAVLLAQGAVAAVGNARDVIRLYLDDGIAQSRTGVISLAAENGGECEVLRIELIGSDGDPMKSVTTWDPVTFRIVMRVDRPLSGVAVEVNISSMSGAVIHTCSTQPDRRIPVRLSEGISYIDCTFPRLLLSAGKYRIGAGISIPNERWLSAKLDRGVFEVEPRDVYGSGCSPMSSRYLIACEYEWGAVRMSSAPPITLVPAHGLAARIQ